MVVGTDQNHHLLLYYRDAPPIMRLTNREQVIVEVAEEQRPHRCGLEAASNILMLWIFPRQIGAEIEAVIIATVPDPESGRTKSPR